MSNKMIKKNTVFNMVKTILGIVYPLVTFPYISRTLMAENVGKINFGNSIVSYFSLIASLGVSTYAIRECSRSKDDREELSKTASEIISINMISTVFSYVVLFLMLYFARVLDDYRVLICIQSSTIIFTTLGAEWVNSAMEDFKYITIRSVCIQLISLILLFVFVHSPDDYLIYAIISVVASSGVNIFNIFYRKKYCDTKLTFRMNIKKHMPPILVLFSLILSQTIFVNSDMTILGLIKGDYEVGLYSVAVKIYNLVNHMVASVTYVVMPQLSANFKKEDYKEVNKLLKYALSFIIVLGLPCIVGINVICKSIIITLSGNQYQGANISLHILSFALASSFVGGWIGNMMMIPAGKEKICLKSSILSAIVNVGLNFILIPKYGLNAAAFTTFIAEFIGIAIKIPYIDKRIKIQGLWEIIKAPVLGSILIVILGTVISSSITSHYMITLLTVITSVLLYAGALYVLKNDFFMDYCCLMFAKIKRGGNR